MLRKLAIYIAGIALATGFAACNKDSEYDTTVWPGSAMVTDFGFRAGGGFKNVDTIFFTIDQANMTIFNADSMPVGANVTNLVPRVTTRGASAIEFHVPRAGKADTVFNYLEEGMDSIDFSRNDVVLRIVSIDGQATSQYKIKVNVHKTVGDTLVWKSMERGTLPTTFDNVDVQRTVATADEYFCLTGSNSAYCMARAADPGADWVYATPNFGFTPDVESLNATKDKLYILDTVGNLYESSDKGVNWTRTGRTWNYIYGGYGSRLLGSRLDNGIWYHVEYPAATTTRMEAGFPVRNTSQTLCRSFEMSAEMQLLLVGGRLADNTVTKDTWAFDGQNWACITRGNQMAYGVENMTLVPYFTVRTDTLSWVTTQKSVLMAMFGNRQDGLLNDTVYVSNDFGMNWTKASKNMQLSKTITPRTRAQGFVYSETLYVPKGRKAAAYGAGWKGLGDLRWTTLFDNRLPASRATKPITDWACPYIYLFGGVDAGGNTCNTLYRGVISRFEFIPIQ